MVSIIGLEDNTHTVTKTIKSSKNKLLSFNMMQICKNMFGGPINLFYKKKGLAVNVLIKTVVSKPVLLNRK